MSVLIKSFIKPCSNFYLLTKIAVSLGAYDGRKGSSDGVSKPAAVGF